MSQHEASLFEVDKGTRSEAWVPPGEIATVLMEGAVPQRFSCPPQALLSDCTSLTAVVSGLDNRAVEYIRDLLSAAESPELRIVLLVHATCPTRDKDLFDLLAVGNTNRCQVWVLPVPTWGQRCSWGLAVRRNSPAHILWTSSAGNFGLTEPAIDEAHLVTEADPLVIDQFVSWFSRLVATAAPLTAETARIPALVPAPGTQEGAEMWDQYIARCRLAASAAVVAGRSAASAASPQSPIVESVAVVEGRLREELKIPKPDPLLHSLVQLFEKGDLVTIDKGSRIPPLVVPIKAEWFGIPSFREVGVVSREVRYKISILDEKTNRAL